MSSRRKGNPVKHIVTANNDYFIPEKDLTPFTNGAVDPILENNNVLLDDHVKVDYNMPDGESNSNSYSDFSGLAEESALANRLIIADDDEALMGNEIVEPELEQLLLHSADGEYASFNDSLPEGTVIVEPADTDMPMINGHGKVMEKFCCHLCNFQTDDRNFLLAHLQALHNSNQTPAQPAIPQVYICKHCDFKTNFKVKWLRHKIKHARQVYQCEECDYASTHFHNMRRHKLKHLQNHQFKCPFCNYSSPRESGVKFHVNQYHAEKVDSGEEYIIHDRFAPFGSKPKPPKRRRPVKKFLSVSGLDLVNYPGLKSSPHPKEHQPPKEPIFVAVASSLTPAREVKPPEAHICVKCGFAASSAQNLQIHEGIHMEPFACDQCSSNYSTLAHLKRHKSMAHQPKQTSQLTTECYDQPLDLSSSSTTAEVPLDLSKSGQTLDQSPTTGNEAQRYYCQYCPKSYKYCSDLYVHIRRVHRLDPVTKKDGKGCYMKYLSPPGRSGDNGFADDYDKQMGLPTEPYQCEFCEFSSHFSGEVKNHIVTDHPTVWSGDEAELEVIMIKIRTKTRNIMPDLKPQPVAPEEPRSEYVHERVRSLIRNDGYYYCDQRSCYMRTSTATSLLNHIAVHENLCVFQCSGCQMRSNYKADVEKHVQQDCLQASVKELDYDLAKITISEYLQSDMYRKQQRKPHYPNATPTTKSPPPGTRMTRAFLCTVCRVESVSKSYLVKHVGKKHPEYFPNAIVMPIQRIQAEEKPDEQERRRFENDKDALNSVTVKDPLEFFVSYKCSICGLKGNKREDLISHVTSYHARGKAKILKQFSYQRFQCAACGLKSSSKGALANKHVMRWHKGESVDIIELDPPKVSPKSVIKLETDPDTQLLKKIVTIPPKKEVVETPPIAPRMDHPAAPKIVLPESPVNLSVSQEMAEPKAEASDSAIDTNTSASNPSPQLDGAESVKLVKFWRCPKCSLMSSDFNLVKAHIGGNHTETRYWCKLCQFNSKHHVPLRRHCLKEHEDQFNHTFEIISTTKDSCSMEPIPKTVSVPIDDEPLETAADLEASAEPLEESHATINEETGESLTPTIGYKCSVCEYVSAYRKSIIRHIEFRHTSEQGGYSGGPDQYCLQIKGDDLPYMQTNVAAPVPQPIPVAPSALTSYRCKICGIISNYRASLSRHMQKRHNTTNMAYCQRVKHSSAVFTDSTNFHCKVCPFQTLRQDILQLHYRMHKPAPPHRTTKCPHCPYYVAFEKQLSQHLKVHTDNPKSLVKPPRTEPRKPQPKKHECDKCPFRAPNTRDLMYHKQFHKPNPTAAFVCHVCGYWARMRNFISKHIRIHDRPATPEPAPVTMEEGMSVEMPVLSPQGKTADEEIINEETVTVTEEDPPQNDDIPADDPEKANEFGSVQAYRTIFGRRAYKCRFCSFRRHRKDHVTKHEKMHQPREGTVACDHCTYNVNSPALLSTHTRTVHESEANPELTESTSDSVLILERPNKSAVEDDSLVLEEDDSIVEQEMAELAEEIQMKPNETFAVFPEPELLQAAAETPVVERNNRDLSMEAIISSLKGHIESEKANTEKQSRGIVERIVTSSASNSKPKKKMVDPTQPGSRSINNPNAKKYKCPKCPYVTTIRANLARHDKLHGASNRCTCSYCDYSTHFNYQVEMHQKMHLKEGHEATDKTVEVSPKEEAKPDDKQSENDIQVEQADENNENQETMGESISETKEGTEQVPDKSEMPPLPPLKIIIPGDANKTWSCKPELINRKRSLTVADAVLVKKSKNC